MEQIADKPKIPWTAKYLSIAVMSWCAWYIVRWGCVVVNLALPSSGPEAIPDGAGLEGIAYAAIFSFCFLAACVGMQTFAGEMYGWYGTIAYAIVIVSGMALWLHSGQQGFDLINWIMGPILIILSIAAIWQYRDYKRFSDTCYWQKESSQTKQ